LSREDRSSGLSAHDAGIPGLEEDHCRMVAVPTTEEEDARRVHRERKALVKEQTRLINRLKSIFACLGIRGFKPTLKGVPDRLDALRTPEGRPVPPRTLAELRQAMSRLAIIKAMREEEIAKKRPNQHHVIAGQLATVHGLGVDTADMLAGEVFFGDIPDRRALARYGGLTGSPDESGKGGARKGWPGLATRAFETA